jgi:hypothetical protein
MEHSDYLLRYILVVLFSTMMASCSVFAVGDAAVSITADVVSTGVSVITTGVKATTAAVNAAIPDKK